MQTKNSFSPLFSKHSALPFLATAAALMISVLLLDAAPPPSVGESAREISPYHVTERGPHHRVWSRVTASTNALGKTIYRTNSYTELATGMHYQKNGKWEESSEEIEITSEGALAAKGPHQVKWSGNINDSVAVELTMPDGKILRSHILGLSYFDSSTGKSVLIAELKDSQGQLLPGRNQVLYSDAFTDIRADVRYTYTKTGLEQDIILREQPPKPEDYGLNPETTRLQVLTEFLDAPAPLKRMHQATTAHAGLDEDLDFGTMTMGEGRAFNLDEQDSSVPVRKQWSRLDGRTFLVEEIDCTSITNQLQLLPASLDSAQKKPASGGSSNRASISPNSILHRVFDQRVLPQRKFAKQTGTALKLASLSTSNQEGFVLDYVIINSGNIVLESGKTYFVTGSAVFVNAIEGGAVVKFTNSANAKLTTFISTKLFTGPYHPAIFTAMDDDTVGETIAGSTGNPTNYYGGGIVIPSGAFIVDGAFRYLRFSYLNVGVSSSSFFAASDLQFIKCKTAINNLSFGQFLLRNALFYSLESVASRATGVQGHFWTVDQCDHLFDHSGGLSLTNSLLVSITNWSAGLNTATVTNSTVVITTNSGIFQQVGAAGHYLVDNSPYRGIGTTNLPAGVLDRIRKKTTYPPIVWSNTNLSSSLTLAPQVLRDTGNLPDPGYHYDPLDYVFADVSLTNATLDLTNGVALGTFGGSSNSAGLTLLDGGILKSTGSADNLNYIVRYNMVQEQMDGTWSTYKVPLLNTPAFTNSTPAQIHLRFTDLAIPAQDAAILDFANGDVSPASFVDCQFRGGALISLRPTVAFTNSLFVGMNITLDDSRLGVIMNPVFRNCLFKGGSLNVTNSGTGSWLFRDNLFDKTSINQNAIVDHAYNGYITNFTRLASPGVGDVILTASPAYPGASSLNPQGKDYLASVSSLLNAGSTNADLLGLYHYTVAFDQPKETNSIVDIGFHYVATSGGRPIDTDGDGLADYVEDSNGNGVIDVGESDPSEYYNGVLPVLTIVGGNGQIGAPGATLDSALVVKVTDTNGVLLNNAPITFTILSGGAQLTNGLSSLSLLSDVNGLVFVNVSLPNTNGVLSTIAASAATGTNQTQVVFWEWSAPSFVSPMIDGDGGVLMVKTNGGIVAWGANDFGQLGDYTWLPGNAVHVVERTNIVKVASSCALDNAGRIWAWGFIGNTYTNYPVQLIGFTNIIDIDVHGDNLLAVKGDGSIWQCELNDFSIPQVTVQVPGISNAVAVARAEAHSLAVLADGKVLAWGQNGQGQLGNGTFVNSAIPVFVQNLTNIISVSAYYDTSFALESSGVLWAWGDNFSGQLGTGMPAANYNTPRQVAGLTNAVAVTAGRGHGFALDGQGNVWAWGNNFFGQLGQGSIYLSTNSPVPVTGISNVVAISSGDWNGFTLDAEGRVWYWGDEWGGDPEDAFGYFVATNSPTLLPAYNDFYQGQLPTLEIIGGNSQIGAPGNYLPAPLSFRVKDAGGNPLANAPISIEVETGNGIFYEDGWNTFSGVRLFTDENGIIETNVFISSMFPTNCSIKVLAASGEKFVEIHFQENIEEINPVVTITSPTYGQTVLVPPITRSITVTVDVQDPDGYVQKVDLFRLSELDGSWLLIGSSTNSPFTLVTTNFALSQDNYFMAVATDNTGFESYNNQYVWFTAVMDTDLDTDSDGIPDYNELEMGFDPEDPSDALLDADGDGLTNLQEYQTDSDLFDYYNGSLPHLEIVSGNNQTGPPDSFLPIPLTIRVTGTNSIPLTNAPITFWSGNVQFAVASNSITQSLLEVRTVSNGLASVWIYFPVENAVSNRISISAWSQENFTQTNAVAFSFLDTDGDGLSDATEIALGTNPTVADTDGDGHPDNIDALPLDPTRWSVPDSDPGDTTPPIITLDEPVNATLIP